MYNTISSIFENKLSLHQSICKIVDYINHLNDNINSIASKTPGTSRTYEVNISDITNYDMSPEELTAVVTAAFNNEFITKINIDRNITILNSLKLRNNLNVYSSNNSFIQFNNCDGFTLQNGVYTSFYSLHDLWIRGNRAPNTTLVKLDANSSNADIYNLKIEEGYNALYVGGWVYNIHDINIFDCSNIGFQIKATDCTLSNFYINGCNSYGAHLKTSNSRIENFKILSCNKTGPSLYFSGSRNSMFGIEIQDIWNSCALIENSNNNIAYFNFDAIRTNITNISPITLAQFKNCQSNNFNLISCKYKADTIITEHDLIKLDSKSVNNNIDGVFNYVKVNGGLNNYYKWLNGIQLPEQGAESDISFNAVGSVDLPNSALAVKVNKSNSLITWGGYRFSLPKKNTKYLIYLNVKTNKKCLLSITNQESGLEYQHTDFKLYPGESFREVRCIITQFNKDISLISGQPDCTLTFNKLNIYELDDSIQIEDLYNCHA